MEQKYEKTSHIVVGNPIAEYDLFRRYDKGKQSYFTAA
jgi:hypothetical protein